MKRGIRKEKKMHYTTSDVARALKTTPLPIRRGLEQGVFPFGCAVQCKKRYVYIIYPNKVEEYLGKIEKEES